MHTRSSKCCNFRLFLGIREQSRWRLHRLDTYYVHTIICRVNSQHSIFSYSQYLLNLLYLPMELWTYYTLIFYITVSFLSLMMRIRSSKTVLCVVLYLENMLMRCDMWYVMLQAVGGQMWESLMLKACVKSFLHSQLAISFIPSFIH